MSSEESKSMLGAALAAIGQATTVSSVADKDANQNDDHIVGVASPAAASSEGAAAQASSEIPTRVSRRRRSASAKLRDAEESSSMQAKDGRQAIGSGRRTVDELEEVSSSSSLGSTTEHGTKSGSKSAGSGFAVSLHAFVAEGIEMSPPCTSWDEDGLSFYVNVKEYHPEWNQLLTKHFGYDAFDTLARQLKSYGFKKSRSKKVGHSLWYHARFSRDAVEYDLITFRDKYVEPSTLPVPMVDNGDLVGRVPRKVDAADLLPFDTEEDSFPVQIHKFVTAMMKSNPLVISFTDDGENIQVREDHPDLADVLASNFKNPGLGFFAQNLLAYGWKRDSDPKLRILYFSHPHFHRDEGKCEFSKIIPRARPGAAKPSTPGLSPSPPRSVPSPSAGWVKNSPVASDEASKEESPPEPKFRVNQTVYARDTDGVMYESVIRRRLYGKSQQKQVQLGLMASEHEAEELLSRDEEPTWHYFVHYNKWNVNWDRWVPQDNVYEATDHIKSYADRLLIAHRSLRAELTKKVKGKKGFQTVEGSEFLQRWRIVRAKLDEEMRPDGDAVPPTSQESPVLKEQISPSKVKKAEINPWSSKSAMANEVKLRERSLTSVGSGSSGGGGQQLQLTLPFALKKCLVESWEVITQCGMVLELPAPVTVRHALDMYLASKGVSPRPNAISSVDKDGNDGKPRESVEPQQQQQNEWRDMADGIALLFDEALPDRLLYREEWPQFHVVSDHPEYSMRPYSDLYGCEHLLRLFVRLPDLVSDGMCESDARPVLAKVNDLVRFLHKNQGTILAQPYRKPTDLELKERWRLTKKEEARRKRQSESTAPSDEECVESKRAKSDLIVEGVEVIEH